MASTVTAPGNSTLLAKFRAVRDQTERLCTSLEPEDFVVQSMPDVSPTRWHLAHTTWFFETFVLQQAASGYEPYDSKFGYLFNSYYNTVGEQFPRENRGLLSRPTVNEIWDYRRRVDEHMEAVLQGERLDGEIEDIVQLGLQHEQQHQELMLTDIKHVFSRNPLRPIYHDSELESYGRHPDAIYIERNGASHRFPETTFSRQKPAASAEPLTTIGAKEDGIGHHPVKWYEFPEGINWIGHEGPEFAFDNELPRHRTFVEAFKLASRPVTNGEFLEFMKDDGYQRPELWLSAGWKSVQQSEWTAPLYWLRRDNQWWHFTLTGLQPINQAEPVCHVSYFEADAFARWRGKRLPTEVEWEIAAARRKVVGNFVDSRSFHPRGLMDSQHGPHQLFGDVWEWTASPYIAFPGFVASRGALGEYNGKFMCNQFVLRGGSCASPQSHLRATYRNFFPPEARWQFSGIRLAA